jgi:EmrB/QacA subfamily drug resistance transporter
METTKPNEKRWLILPAMCLVLFIISIDNTVLNLALAPIARGLNATASELQWVVDGYTLIFASLLITTGSFGDRYGRKRMLLIGLGLFGLGSLGAALSTSTAMLIGFRFLTGFAGACMMPSTLSILINVFTDPKERAKAIAIWSSIFSVGAGIGPIIGGFLIDSFDWAAVFYLNVPIVIISIIAITILAPESRGENAPKPDLPGVTLSTTGLIALVYAVIRAGETGWSSAPVWIAFAAAVALLGGFGWWENHSPNPMLPLHLFKNMAFTGANAALTISAFAMMGSMYFFSQYFQTIEGYTPLIAALCMLPMTPAVLVSTMESVRLDRKIGAKLTVSLGLLVSGMGLFVFSRLVATNTPYGYVLLSIVLLGLGIGCTMSPATNSVMNSLPPNRSGIGSAMNDTTRQLGGALGVAVLGSVLNGTYRAGVNPLAAISGVSAVALDQIRSSVQSAHMIAAALGGSLNNQVMQISDLAFVNGMKNALLIGSLVMAAASLTALVILPRRAKKTELERSVNFEE